VAETHDEVSSAVCSIYKKSLILYLILSPSNKSGNSDPNGMPGEGPSKELLQDVRQLCVSQLPDYMVPHSIDVLDSFPLNLNGKVNRSALPAPEIKSEATESTDSEDTRQVDQMTKLEEEVCSVFTDILCHNAESDTSRDPGHIEKIDIKKSFFEMGGDSLSAIQLVSALHSKYPALASFTVVNLFQNPSVREIASVISATALYVVHSPDYVDDVTDDSKHGVSHSTSASATVTATTATTATTSSATAEAKSDIKEKSFCNRHTTDNEEIDDGRDISGGQRSSKRDDCHHNTNTNDRSTCGTSSISNAVFHQTTLQHQSIGGHQDETRCHTEPEQHNMVCLQPGTGQKIPLLLVPGAGASALCFRPLAAIMGHDYPIYALNDNSLNLPDLFTCTSIEEVASIYADKVLSCMKGLKVHDVVLGGWSYGGVVAVEAARQLKASKDIKVDSMLLFDAPLKVQGDSAREKDLEDPDSIVAQLLKRMPELQRSPEIAFAAAQHFIRCTELLHEYSYPSGGDDGLLTKILSMRPETESVCLSSDQTLAAAVGGEWKVSVAPGDHWTMLNSDNIPAIAEILCDFFYEENSSNGGAQRGTSSFAENYPAKETRVEAEMRTFK